MKQKQNHKPFTKPFWFLLGSSIGVFALVYGGVVWATFSDALECSGAQREWCIKIGVKDALFFDGEKADVRTTAELSAENNYRLQLTNDRSDREYFVPLKNTGERAAFLTASEDLS
jgi:hypothetical protein